MRTALLQAPRKLAVVERAKPAPGAGEVIIETAATAVCHTDLSIYVGEHPGVHYPVVMGHESTGIVDSIGEGVTGLKSGEHVIINPIITCGTCDQCVRGAGNLCRNAGLFGREIEGSLSQYVKLPSRYVHVLPPRLPLEALEVRLMLQDKSAAISVGEEHVGVEHLAGEFQARLIETHVAELEVAVARRVDADVQIEIARVVTGRDLFAVAGVM